MTIGIPDLGQKHSRETVAARISGIQGRNLSGRVRAFL
jgi:hypothetical protein